MPQNKYALLRYRVIDSLLLQHEYVKTTLMADFCRVKTGYRVSIRTIQMDIDAMKHDPFLGYYAPIEYSQRLKSYYYSNNNYKLFPFKFNLEEISFMESMLSQFEKVMNSNQYCLLMNIILKMKL